MSDKPKTSTLAVPLTREDRERFRDSAAEIGMPAATDARVLIKRDLNSEPVAA